MTTETGPFRISAGLENLIGRELVTDDFAAPVSCAVAYDAHLPQLGRIPILRARMNADLHLAEDLTTTGKGNLFVVFGEPDLEIESAGGAPAADGLRVRLRRDVSGPFPKPATGRLAV